MWVICGIIVGKQFNNNAVAVPVTGFKLLDLSSWQYSQISLFDLIKNNNSISKPMNLVDTLERWHRCKRSDFSPELCVNSKFYCLGVITVSGLDYTLSYHCLT